MVIYLGRWFRLRQNASDCIYIGHFGIDEPDYISGHFVFRHGEKRRGKLFKGMVVLKAYLCKQTHETTFFEDIL